MIDKEFVCGEVLEGVHIICSYCGNEVYRRNGCGDYLMIGNPVYCNGSEHYCQQCYDEEFNRKTTNKK